jgi:hypothetical protein
MTQKQLFEILKNKFENLEFICSNYDENKFCFIYSDKLKFFSYHNDADKDESAIWYLSLIEVDREIEIPNKDTGLFIDGITDIIVNYLTFVKLNKVIHDQINNLNIIELIRDSKINKIL